MIERKRIQLLAFTLVELLIVLFIVAIASAIAIPRYFQTIQRHQVEYAYNRVLLEVNNAVILAKSTGKQYSIVFLDNTGNLHILDSPGTPDEIIYKNISLSAPPYNSQIRSSQNLLINGRGQIEQDVQITIFSGQTQRDLFISKTQ